MPMIYGADVDPSYDINELINDCSDPTKVYITAKALETAQTDFGLNSSQEILDFISNQGLEKLNFFNSEIWDNNPRPDLPTMVDAHEFYSGFKFGYFAFLKNPIPNAKKWLIKSFKLNKNTGSATFPFKDLLKDFNLKLPEE